jgi:hypothetical protein
VVAKNDIRILDGMRNLRSKVTFSMFRPNYTSSVLRYADRVKRRHLFIVSYTVSQLQTKSVLHECAETCCPIAPKSLDTRTPVKMPATPKALTLHTNSVLHAVHLLHASLSCHHLLSPCSKSCGDLLVSELLAPPPQIFVSFFWNNPIRILLH